MDRRVRFGLLSGGVKFEFRAVYNALLDEPQRIDGRVKFEFIKFDCVNLTVRFDCGGLLCKDAGKFYASNFKKIKRVKFSRIYAKARQVVPAKLKRKFGKFKQNAGDYSCISIHFCAILTALVAAPTRIWSALHHR